MYFGHLFKEEHGLDGGSDFKMVQISGKQGFTIRTAFAPILHWLLTRKF